MRILFIQKNKGIAGSERYLIDLLPALKKRGHDVEFLNVYPKSTKAKSDSFKQALEQDGIVVHDIELKSSLSPLLFATIGKHIRQGKYDLVQSNLIHADLWCSLSKRKYFPNVPLISVKHGYNEGFLEKHSMNPDKVPKDLYYWINKLAGRNIDKHIMVSNALKDVFVQSKLAPAEKIEVIHHGIKQAQKDNSTSESQLIRYGEPQIILVGRFVKLKGHHFILKAMPIIAKAFPKVKLVFLGSGPLRNETEQMVHDLGMTEFVEFVGFKSNVNEFIASSDLSLVMSTAEGFGLVLLESFQNKTAVLSFDVPACNEIIEHNKTGILIPPFDIEELAKQTIDLLSDKEKRAQLVQAAFEKYTSYFSHKRMVDDLERTYLKLIKH